MKLVHSLYLIIICYLLEFDFVLFFVFKKVSVGLTLFAVFGANQYMDRNTALEHTSTLQLGFLK